jgi:hypothetical protein
LGKETNEHVGRLSQKIQKEVISKLIQVLNVSLKNVHFEENFIFSIKNSHFRPKLEMKENIFVLRM